MKQEISERVAENEKLSADLRVEKATCETFQKKEILATVTLAALYSAKPEDVEYLFNISEQRSQIIKAAREEQKINAMQLKESPKIERKEVEIEEKKESSVEQLAQKNDSLLCKLCNKSASSSDFVIFSDCCMLNFHESCYLSELEKKGKCPYCGQQ